LCVCLKKKCCITTLKNKKKHEKNEKINEKNKKKKLETTDIAPVPVYKHVSVAFYRALYIR